MPEQPRGTVSFLFSDIEGSTRLFDVVPIVADYPEQVSRTIWQDHPGVLDLV